MYKKLLLILLSSTVLLSTAFSQEKRKRPSKKIHTATKTEVFKASNGMLKSGTFHIKQSWSDVSDYERPVHVQVPPGEGPFPVYIALHGRGGTGSRKLMNLKRMTDRIVIAPDGYNKGWSEKRPDVDFIRQIIAYIKTCKVVDGSNIAIHGSSNGAGLLFRLMIELEEGAFQHGICGIGGLTPERYDGSNFLWDPTKSGTLKTPIIPAKGRRWLQINGTEDQIVPYTGGVGTLGIRFLPAQDTFYNWAVHMGETGPKLADSAGKPHKTNKKLMIYEYLNGNFKHVKALGYKHGVKGQEIKAIIHEFISQPPM
jgi:poly(3-hydroxybutyrate) depolymerase